MYVKIAFARDFRHDNVDNVGFTLDVDPNENISNVKTLITMKYTDLDPAYLALLYRNAPLKDDMKCIQLLTLMPPPSEICLVCANRSVTGCCIIF